MEMYQYHFELIYRIIRKQNEDLVKEISKREGIPLRELVAMLPSRRDLKAFSRHHRPESDTVPANPGDAPCQANIVLHMPDSPAQ